MAITAQQISEMKARLEEMRSKLPDNPATQKMFAQIEAKISQAESDLINGRYEELSNPESEYYTKMREYFQGIASKNTPTVNSLIGLSMAVGGGYKGSQAIANEQRQAIEARNVSAVNESVNNAYINSQGMANNVLNMGIQNNQFNSQLAEQRRQYNTDKETSFENQLLTIGGGLVGNYLGGGFLGNNLNKGSGNFYSSNGNGMVNGFLGKKNNYQFGGSYGGY